MSQAKVDRYKEEKKNRKKIQNPWNGKPEGEIENQNVENQDKKERNSGKPPKGRCPVE